MIIAHLRGTILKKSTDVVIVDVSGVGYRVGISRLTAEQLPEIEESINLHIYHHITEVSQSLFGFLSENDQKVFELLITVKSVGPRLALSIMSGIQGMELIDYILQKDVNALSRIPGIGKKTAERIILELQDRLELQRKDLVLPPNMPRPDTASEAIAALIALGFKRALIENVVYSIIRSESNPSSVSDIIKSALRQLQS